MTAAVGRRGIIIATALAPLSLALPTASEQRAAGGQAPVSITHPLGQTLIVLSGLGLVQREGGPVEEVRPGDVVWFAPGVKHWHGASPRTAMTHIAIQEALDGNAVEWLEHVTDEQYGGK